MKTIIFDLDGTLVDLVPAKYFKRQPKVIQRISKTELEQLRKRYCFSLVTGSCRKEALYALQQMGWTDLFDQKLILCADDIPAEKKTGIPFSVIKQQADVICIIGDSEIDRLGAKRANIDCIIVKTKTDLQKALQKL